MTEIKYVDVSLKKNKFYGIEQLCKKIVKNSKNFVVLIQYGNSNYADDTHSCFRIYESIDKIIKMIMKNYFDDIRDANDIEFENYYNCIHEKDFNEFQKNNILYGIADHCDFRYLKIYGLDENQFNQINEFITDSLLKVGNDQ